eukprot:COSAG04_NODE_19028_length_426_cov_1.391437_1_plen_97_part_01
MRRQETLFPLLYAFTYHQYGGGGSTDLTGNSYESGPYSFAKPWLEKYAPSAEIWLGEGGGTGCGGGPVTTQPLSNTNRDIFWYLDTLGDLAKSGRAS